MSVAHRCDDEMPRLVERLLCSTASVNTTCSDDARTRAEFLQLIGGD